jgi:hypothetical protein
MSEVLNNNDDVERKKLLSGGQLLREGEIMTTGDQRMLPGGDLWREGERLKKLDEDTLSLHEITEGYPDPKQDTEDNVDWLTFPQPDMVGESKVWTNPLNDKNQEVTVAGGIPLPAHLVGDSDDEWELNDITAEQQRRAEILYGKANKIPQKDAAKILSQNPALFQEWANK